MFDPAEQLQRIYAAGFELQTFERFPSSVGVVRDNCIALLEVTPQGLRMLGTPGWRMGEVMGVLVEREGRQVFQAKSELVDATAERLQVLRRFRIDLERVLAESGPQPRS
jgi:hypothetical protein